MTFKHDMSGSMGAPNLGELPSSRYRDDQIWRFPSRSEPGAGFVHPHFAGTDLEGLDLTTLKKGNSSRDFGTIAIL